VVKDKKQEGTAGISMAIVIVYLISSFFASIIFSCLAFQSRKNGNGGWGWIILSLVCVVIFGYLSLAFIETSSPTHDKGWYYLGCSTLVSNAISMFIMFFSLFIKRN
jgi:hypothetical protein